MRNVKKLLVPVDFSPQSEKALKYASSLAAEINAEMVALYVVEDMLEEGNSRLYVSPRRLFVLGRPTLGAPP
jgi:nucleotide-binding universal stress UspA family protein